jgi:hypothetical protein
MLKQLSSNLKLLDWIKLGRVEAKRAWTLSSSK